MNIQKNNFLKWCILGILVLFIGLFIALFLDSFNNQATIFDKSIDLSYSGRKGVSPLVASARNQIGVVTKYDTQYYIGGYPPSDRGACTDVIERALRDNGYNLKQKIDEDMKAHPNRYSDTYDPNINFRRVRNIQIFFDFHYTKLSDCITDTCFQEGIWQPGDIITFDQIPGSLWHIAIISDHVSSGNPPIPYLIHNYGKGVVEDNMLLKWPSKISGHYRIKNIE